MLEERRQAHPGRFFTGILIAVIYCIKYIFKTYIFPLMMRLIIVLCHTTFHLLFLSPLSF